MTIEELERFEKAQELRKLILCQRANLESLVENKSGFTIGCDCNDSSKWYIYSFTKDRCGVRNFEIVDEDFFNDVKKMVIEKMQRKLKALETEFANI